MGAAGLDAEHYAFASQANPGAGPRQFGEQNFQMDESSDWRQRIRKDVNPGSIDIPCNTLATVRIPTLGRPLEDRWSAQPVAFGFPQLFNSVHMYHFQTVRSR